MMPFGQYKGELGYQMLVADVLDLGVDTPDRTGIGCRKIFNAQLIYNVGEVFPFSTIRPAPLRLAFEEFSLFLKGETDTTILEEKGINFWKGNTSREFLDNRGMQNYPVGSLGKSYSYQFRNFNGEVDQLQKVYDQLINDPFSRRHLVTFWNPADEDEMPLTPCWYEHIFFVDQKENGRKVLNMKLNSRSLDLIFGATFATQQYALYLTMMAKITDMDVGWVVCDLTDVHIYNNQIEFAQEVVNRDLGKVGTINFKAPLETLEDMINYKWDDIEVVDLEVNDAPFKAKRPPMAV